MGGLSIDEVEYWIYLDGSGDHHGMGLFVAPKEVMMGDVGRILYVHVPTAWVALLTYLIVLFLESDPMDRSKKGAPLVCHRGWVP